MAIENQLSVKCGEDARRDICGGQDKQTFYWQWNFADAKPFVRPITGPR